MRRPFLALSIAIATAVSGSAQRGAVRIHVVDFDSGVPIVRARLASESTVPLPRLFTDEHGDVSVDIAGAARTIRISKPGYVPRSLPVGAASDRLDVALARGASVTGRVVDALGAPVAGMAVYVIPGERGQRTQAGRTNDLGDYRVGTLPAGGYTVSLTSPSRDPGSAGAVSRDSEPDVLPHTVVLRRGDDVGGIDFAVSPRVTCRAQDVPPLPGSAYGSGSIRGRVTTKDGRPLACVNVVAYRGADRISAAVTDGDGRYTLRGLRGGAYPVEFKRSGYVTLQWGQLQAGHPGRPVALRDREDLQNIDITLPRGGAITGTIVDEFGEPAENVMVRAMQLLAGDDRTIAVSAGSAQTDDRGKYRVAGLPPGRYVVGTAATDEPPDPRTGKGYAPAYYPGSVDIASAMPVDVQEERERQWTDFARVPTRVATITGTALNSRDEPVTDRVILVASQRSGAVIAETQGAEVKAPDGMFAIPNVPPGDYVLQATSKRPGEASPEFGMQYVTVYEDDPPPARLKTSAGTDVQGRLIEDGVPLVDPQSFGIVAVPVDWDQTSLLAGSQSLAAAADGSLFLGGVTGPRRFVLTAVPGNWYLKSVRLQGRDITDEVMGFPMRGLIRDLEVVVSNKGATLQGDAIDGAAPAGDYSVVLFSSDPLHWFRNSRFLRTARATRAGKFRIDGIADGDYWVVAVDPLDGSAGAAWQDREFLQAQTLNARRVRLREGDDRNISLALTHR